MKVMPNWKNATFAVANNKKAWVPATNVKI